MAILTVSDIREHYNTDAADAAIQRLLDAEEEAILRYVGPASSDITQVFLYPPKNIVLDKEAIAIVSVTEDDEVLTTDEYTLLDGGRILVRKGWIFDTSYVYWGEDVEVVYTPYDDSDSRARVQAYLVGIGLAQNGYRVERNTEILQEPLNYQKERVRTLRSLKRGFTFA